MADPHGPDHRDFQLQFDKVVFVPVVQNVRCAAMSFGCESFAPAGAYDYAWVSVKPMKGKYIINYIQYPLDVGCVCTLNDWICSIDDFCADNHNYFQFKLKGKGRSAVCAATQVRVCDETVELSQLLLPAPGGSTLLRWSMSMLCSSIGAVRGLMA